MNKRGKRWAKPQVHTWCDETKKRGYASKVSARRAHATSSERLRYYRCPSCQAWHATSRADSRVVTRDRGSRERLEALQGHVRRRTPLDPLEHDFVDQRGSCFVCGQAEARHG